MTSPDYLDPIDRCDHCDRTIWDASDVLDCDNVACTETGCEEVRTPDGYVFCSVECRAPSSSTLLPAPATASHGTRGTCVASVPSSSPARRPAVASTGADLSSAGVAP